MFFRFVAVSADSWVKPISLGILLLSVVLIQGWWRDPTILFFGNPAAWALTCEAFFYALHPAINRILGRLAKRGALILAVGTVGAAVAYRVCVLAFPGLAFSDVPWPIVRITEFIIGMAITRAIASGWRVTLNPVWCYLVGGLILGAIGFGGRFSVRFPALSAALPFANEIIIVIFAVTIAAIAARDLRGGRSLLRSRPFVALGDMSYAFYLPHATVIYSMIWVVGVHGFGAFTAPLWLLALAASIGGAAALHYLLERPLEKRMRSWWDRRRAAKSAHQEGLQNVA